MASDLAYDGIFWLGGVVFFLDAAEDASVGREDDDPVVVGAGFCAIVLSVGVYGVMLSVFW